MIESLVISRSSPVLNIATAVSVALLACGGFTLSFASLRDLAIASGIPPELAFIWPLIVDGFIVVATAAAFVLGRAGRGVSWYPWAALVLFSAISVTGNALHATEAHLRVPTPVATIVSAVPAIALLIASHLLVVMVSSGRREKKRAPQRAKSHVAPVVQIAAEPEKAPALAGKAKNSHVSEARVLLEARVREAVAEGTHVTGAMAAEWADAPLTTAKRWLNDIKKMIAVEEAASTIPTIGVKA